MKKLILIAFSFVFLISLVSAYSLVWDFGIITHQQNECFNIPAACDNCTYINITILYPNGTIAVDNQPMTNLSSIYYYNYTFCNTSTLGIHTFITNYDEDEYSRTYSDFNFFDITINGNERPEGIVKVIFIAFFIVILFGSLVSFLKILGHWKDLEVDIMDFAQTIGIYLVIFAYQYFAITYLGDPVINDLMEIFVIVGAITHAFVPTAAFLASLILNPFKKGVNQ